MGPDQPSWSQRSPRYPKRFLQSPQLSWLLAPRGLSCLCSGDRTPSKVLTKPLTRTELILCLEHPPIRSPEWTVGTRALAEARENPRESTGSTKGELQTSEHLPECSSGIFRQETKDLVDAIMLGALSRVSPGLGSLLGTGPSLAHTGLEDRPGLPLPRPSRSPTASQAPA